jgi:hypothetical protein
MHLTEQQVHVIRLDKGVEHYVFLYDKHHIKEVLLQLSRWAMNPELTLNWFDAARLSHEVRNF